METLNPELTSQTSIDKVLMKIEHIKLALPRMGRVDGEHNNYPTTSIKCPPPLL